MTVHGAVKVSTTEIDDDARFAYLNGQCFALAVALAEKHNKEIGLLVQVDDIPWGTRYEESDLRYNPDDWFIWVHHAIVLTEDSIEDEAWTMDIGGERDMGGVRAELEDIHGGSLVRIKPDSLRKLLSKYEKEQGFCKQNYTAAVLVADLL